MGTIKCDPKELADALAAVKPAVWTRSAVQAHAGVRIDANSGGVKVTATNLDLWIRRDLPGASADGETCIIVSHAELVKVAKAFAKFDSLTLATCVSAQNEQQMLVCRSGQRKIELRSCRMEDWPKAPNVGGAEILVGANGAKLAAIIERAAKFASKDETRPILTGIRLECENDRLALVSTDSYRLCALTLEGEHASAGGFTIGGAGLAAAAKLMRKAENVTVRAYDPELHTGHAVIEFENTRVLVRTVDGNYPNWKQLIPDSFPNEVTIPVAELRSAADVAVQFMHGKAPTRFNVNGEVKLHAWHPDGPSYEEVITGAKARMPVTATEANITGENHRPIGEEFEIGFNPEFLRDIAHTLDGEYTVVKLISPLRPALIESQQGAEKYLLAPVRLNV